MEKINPEWAKGIQCRNITIHGFCKYEGKGCSFSHDDSSKKPDSTVNSNVSSLSDQTKSLSLDNNGNHNYSSRPTTSSTSNSTATAEPVKKKFNAASAGFTPSSALTGNRIASPKLADIASFIPSQQLPPFESMRSFNADSPAFTPSINQPPLQPSPPLHNPYLHQDPESPVAKFNPYAQSNDQANMFQGNPPQNFMFQPQQPSQQQQFQPPPVYPLQYHLYAPTPPPHLRIQLKGNEENAQTLFIPNKLREALTQKNVDTLSVLPHSNLPEYVDVYYDLYPLDKTIEKSEKSYGFTNSLFKAFSNNDGHVYTLRRIENVQISKDKSVATINLWKTLTNSNVAKVVDAFTTRAFGDNSLIIVYDFYPSAKTLDEIHNNPIIGKAQPVKEQLWTYLIQISMALAAIHSKKLAARSISLQKVLVTSKNRLRLSDVGVSDILEYKEDQTDDQLLELQLNDLTQLGKLILELASIRSPPSMRSLSDLELINVLDSIDADMKSALRYLLDGSFTRSISEFQKLISSRIVDEFDKVEQNADYYEAQLTREVENSRLVRLMSKLNFIINRPELANSLSPTGDKYPIALFHNYIFHQVNEQGTPVLDLSHVLRCLNKLDVGIDEKVLLVSSDEQSCLIVSYRDMKDMIGRTFTELLKESNP